MEGIKRPSIKIAYIEQNIQVGYEAWICCQYVANIEFIMGNISTSLTAPSPINDVCNYNKQAIKKAPVIVDLC